MMKCVSNKAGFSLIEVIVVLIISGILAVLAGFGIINAVNGFLSQKTNSETAYKGQLAMIRISKEFRNLAAVTSGQGLSTSIEYHIYRKGALETHKLSWSGIPGDPLLYDDFSGNGSILVDAVKNFTLEYYNAYDDKSPASTWNSSIVLIGITLELMGKDTKSSLFSGRIAPRNLP